MNFLPEKGYKRILCIIAYAVFGAAALFAVSKYVVPALLPFLIAWLVAALLQRPVVFAEKKLKIPKKIAAAVLVMAFLGAASLIIVALVSILIRQGGEFADNISNNMQKITNGAGEILEKIGGFLEKIGIKTNGNIPELLNEALTSLVGALTSKLTGVAASFASSLPKAFIFFFAMLISCVYFCADYRKIADFLLSSLPNRAARALSSLKKEFSSVTSKYFRSYALIFFMTFGELFLGFSLIGTGSEILLAFSISFIDVLPVLGTGIVLVPWAVVELMTGNVKTGVSVLALYGVISLVRQLVEPHIVGRGIGLDPALSVVAMYVGLKMYGIAGMIFMPLAAAVVKNTAATFFSEKK